MSDEPGIHLPVMESEVAEFLRLTHSGTILVDCTLGYGGHSAVLTRDFGPDDTLIGVDRDAQALAYCQKKFANAPFSVYLRQRGFEELKAIFEEAGIEFADFFLFDLGFSSPQVDRGERGFSFMREGPLDMRMDQRQALSAKDVILMWSERELADLFKNYGEERFSRKIAKAIIRRRQEAAIETTQELADLVIQAIPARNRYQEGIHPATRVFQALRIAVNNELESLRIGLSAALTHLKPGGRVAVLSYHSLEHRIVKELFRGFCQPVIHAPGIPVTGREDPEQGTILTRKAVCPCAAEQSRNPRSRSAQLRVLERTPGV
jgi:16S rRNA (cytosine1402-N4)-methyltransferase